MLALLALACIERPGRTPKPTSPTSTTSVPPRPVPTIPTTTPTPPPPPPTLEVAAVAPTSLGTDALSVNGRIQPHGHPTTWWIEYGPTSAYGRRSPVRTLGPRLAAHYVETWDEGLGGWLGGGADGLSHVGAGGAAGGFVRYAEPAGTDYNHTDGIGYLHLVQYMYPGRYVPYDSVVTALGGGDPDLTDARVEVSVRGVDWAAREGFPDPSTTPFDRGDELAWWSQVDASAGRDFSQMSNWAHTGGLLTEGLYDGDWHAMSYRLEADSNQWSYGGQDRSQGRDVYVYHPLAEVLRHADVDVFHLLLFVDDGQAIDGSIDLDELHVTYRDHSLLFPSNGATLVDGPAGAEVLTDGWRSTAFDPGPGVVRWSLATDVVVERVQVHGDVATEVVVRVSGDGVGWTEVLAGAIPDPGVHGPNVRHLLATGLSAPARAVEVELLGGALGEVELFGTGAVEGTDDDWYGVTEDLEGLRPGAEVHHRVVAAQGEHVVAGPDVVSVIPDGSVAEVETRPATVFATGRRVRLAGMVNTLGRRGRYRFELGPDDAYGHATVAFYTGPELTPRHVSRVVELDHAELADLAPGGVAHYRLAFCDACDDLDPANDRWVYGADATFAVP